MACLCGIFTKRKYKAVAALPEVTLEATITISNTSITTKFYVRKKDGSFIDIINWYDSIRTDIVSKNLSDRLSAAHFIRAGSRRCPSPIFLLSSLVKHTVENKITGEITKTRFSTAREEVQAFLNKPSVRIFFISHRIKV